MSWRLATSYWLLVFAALSRPYYAMTPAELSKGYSHTHVSVTGKVGLVKKEADGDLHIRLNDLSESNKFIVAECIPELPCSVKPKVGAIVSVKGLARKDDKHNWYEVHPVEQISIQGKR